MPQLNEHTLGRLCREIAAGLAPLPILLQEWGLVPHLYEELKLTPAYRHEMSVIAQEVQELGNDAGYVYRMKSLSEEFITTIVDIMRDPETSKSMKFDVIRFCAEMARLKEKPQSAAQQAQLGPRGPTVVFQLGAGLPVSSITVQPVDEFESAPPIDLTPTSTPLIPSSPPPPAAPGEAIPWRLEPVNE